MAAAKSECIHEQAHNREALLLTAALILTNKRGMLPINQSLNQYKLFVRYTTIPEDKWGTTRSLSFP